MTFYQTEDMSCYDFTWFAVDKNNEIAALSKGATGLFPTFLTKESYLLMQRYFNGEIEDICESSDDSGWDKLSLDHARHLSRKGLYTYSAESKDDDPDAYYRYTSPSKPLTYNEVPEDVQKILDLLRLPVEFKNCLHIDKRDIPSPYF